MIFIIPAILIIFVYSILINYKLKKHIEKMEAEINFSRAQFWRINEVINKMISMIWPKVIESAGTDKKVIQ